MGDAGLGGDAEWARAERLAIGWKSRHLRREFAQNPGRAARYRFQWPEVVGPELAGPELVVDWSKHRIDDESLGALVALAERRGVFARRDSMLRGEPINSTENRAVMHTALRHLGESPVYVSGKDVMPEVRAVRDSMRDFVSGVESGRIAGSRGHRFSEVVHIGIGGSDLGPAMVYQALSAQRRPGMRVQFVSNIDGQEVTRVLASLDPAETLVLVASKTFTTTETLTNARTVRRWLVNALGEVAVSDHFVALSANVEQAAAFGIRRDRVFGFWDWVGGRYSLWSAIGMPVALAVGYDAFEELLAGAAEMDAHFATAAPARNLPVVLGLLTYWYGAFFGARAHAVLPYDRRLARLAAYLQQADMESNGKSTRIDGSRVTETTGPVVFGEPGTNAQHSFFQWLHQSPEFAPADFLVCARVPSEAAAPGHHEILLANCLAQAEALMVGKTRDEVERELQAKGLGADEIEKLAPHKVFEGNRPSTTWMVDELTPRNLGRILAAFEHAIFVSGAMWGINSFDQWGVELGKILAQTIEPEIVSGVQSDHDSSTGALIELARYWRD